MPWVMLLISFVLSFCITQGQDDIYLAPDFCIKLPNGAYSYPNNCNQYVICNNGQRIVQTCPEKLLFNVELAVCDFPFNVRCPNHQSSHLGSRGTEQHTGDSYENGVNLMESNYHPETTPRIGPGAQDRETGQTYQRQPDLEYQGSRQTEPDNEYTGPGQTYVPDRTHQRPRQTQPDGSYRRTGQTYQSEQDRTYQRPRQTQPDGSYRRTGQTYQREPDRTYQRPRQSYENEPVRTYQGQRNVFSSKPERGYRVFDTVHSETPNPRLLHTSSGYGNSECSPGVFSADPDSCQHYMQCVNGHLSRLPCPSGTYFNPDMQYCGSSSRVCKDRSYGQSQVEERRVQEEEWDSREKIDEIDELISQAKAMMNDALKEAGYKVMDRRNKEAFRAQRIKGTENRPFSGVSGFLGSTPYVKQLSLPAEQQLEALRSVKKRLNLSGPQMSKLYADIGTPLRGSNGEVSLDMEYPRPDLNTCPYPMNNERNDCNPEYRYRSLDGSCNNLQRPLWGKSFRALRRYLPPDYADGIDEPRRARSGRELPSAREVSRIIHGDADKPDEIHTMMTVVWGQFLDHDMTRTAVTKLNKDPFGRGDMVDVTCGSDMCQTEGADNQACLPIRVSRQDKQFGNKPCHMFVRTQEVMKDDCTLGPREQLNQLTSYLDASNVYGSTKNESDILRDFSNPNRGRLNVTRNLNPRLLSLPPQTFVKDCREVTETFQCFLAGDKRVNENVQLIALHTIFLRYHNALEERLHKLNPHWSGETLFQETRRIVGAINQRIIYAEYLPLVLGPAKMKEFALELAETGFSDGYDTTVNADVTNSFATAAFRFAHSTLDGLVRFARQNLFQFETIELSRVLRRPFEAYNNSRPGGSAIDSITRGIVSQPMQKSDQFFSKEVTSRLFSENPPNEVGMDLAAINGQRGRDHGLASYNEWRKWCGLTPARSFEDMLDLPKNVSYHLSNLYETVDDVDLYVAAISEFPVPGGIVGPTFACIIGRQFHDSRYGDRFWHERNDPILGFTPAQLAEIRKVTLSRVMCDTLDDLGPIQKFSMLQPKSIAQYNIGKHNYRDIYSLASLYKGEENERKPCYVLPQLDISKWRSQRYH